MNTNADQFTKQLEAFSNATVKAMTNTLRELVVDIGACVIKFSPVLTGRFKGNWQMTVGSPSNHSLPTYDPEGQATLAKIKMMAQTLQPGEIAYIVNNLTYAYNVEVAGWQVTPPYQPVSRTMAEFDALAQEAILRNKVK